MKVALNLANLTETDTLVLANAILSSLPNVAGFTPKPTVAALTTLANTAQQALVTVANAKQALALAVTNKDSAFVALRDGLTDEAASVQAAADALPAAQQQPFIEGAGMRVQKERARVTGIGPVVNLSLSAGDLPGTLDWHCDPVAHRSFYVVEYTTEPVGPSAQWAAVQPATKSSGTISGLTSGAAVSVRVHAVGAHELVGAPAVAGPRVVP